MTLLLTTSAAVPLALLLLVAAPTAWGQQEPSAAGTQDDGGTPVAKDAEVVAAVDPDAPTVGASLDRSEAHVGDQLTLTVTAVAAGAIAETVKLARPELGKFEILDSSQADQDLGDGRKRRRFVLQIAAYEIGDFEIPSVTLGYQSPSGGERRVKTAPMSAAIRKVVDDPNAELQPLAHTREVQVEDRRPLQALVGLGVLIALLVLGLVTRALVRRRRRREAAAPLAMVQRPAHEIALERLAEIGRRGQLSRQSYQPFHFELAEVVRGYLGARYGFDSLELTTTELLEELGTARAQAPEFARVRRFLDDCDLVKFARAASTDEAAGALLGEAEAIVRATMWVAPASDRQGVKVAHG